MRYFNLLKNLSNWWLYLAAKFGFQTRDPLMFRTRSGVAVEVPRRLLQTFKEIFMSECYCKGISLPAVDRPVVIDVGANAGFFSLFVLSRLRDVRVFSYEPMPANFTQLKRNLGLNPGRSARCFQMAVGGQEGTLMLVDESGGQFTTSARVYQQADGNAATITVPCTTLAGIFQENHIERCDLLKMDCEGAELDILYKCPQEILTRISSMAMEVHGGLKAEQDLEVYLQQKGFSVLRHPAGMFWAWRKPMA